MFVTNVVKIPDIGLKIIQKEMFHYTFVEDVS